MSTLAVPAVRGLKFGTPRNLERPSLGPIQGQFARIWLGQPFMPWQQLVADVTGELDPVTLLPAYSMCVITVQRQAGKSHLAMAQTGERCFTRPGFKAWYTAQAGKDARDQFLKFNDDVVDGTPLARIVRTLRGNGSEIMRFPRRSWLRPHPPSEESLHGKQGDRNDIDEAWAFSKEHGDLLLTAISPTQLTRPGAQTFVWSAGGTAASTWLAELVARGRDGDPEIAYFEFGIPDDADPEDLDVIAEHHPAYGYTITRDSLRAMRTQLGTDAAGWARSAGNRWTEIIGGLIDAQLWERNRWPDPIPDDAPVGYGAARAADGSQVAIATAAQLADGTIVAEILDVLPTAYRAAEHVAGWATDGPVAIARSGPSASLADDLVTNEYVDVLELSDRDYSAACANVTDALAPRAYRYRRHPALDAAVAVAGKRSLGDGGFVWARMNAGAPVAALEAVTAAIWAVTHRGSNAAPLIEFS